LPAGICNFTTACTFFAMIATFESQKTEARSQTNWPGP